MDTNETEMEKEFLNFCKKKKKIDYLAFFYKSHNPYKRNQSFFYPRKNSRTAKSIMYIKFMKPTN